MNKLIIILVAIIVLSSCSSTNSLYIDVLEPAPISLPNEAKNIGIVGRTKSSSSTSSLNKLDQVLSVELLKIDSIASRKTILGLYEELSKNTKFDNVVSLSNIELENSAISKFSPTLSKSEVSQICIDNNLDLLFVLEYFDTFTDVDYSVVPVTTTVLGVTVNAVETMASVQTIINAGFRIYSSDGNIVYDEFAYQESVVSTGKGINPMNAIAAVAGHKNNIENASYDIGTNYGLSLLPYQITVQRLYFVRGNDNFKIAKRRAQTGNWSGAGDLWLQETTNPEMKIAGRAFYNMAIINEINGDLETAIDYAQKSYADYGNKKALRYSKILQDRKIRNDELKRQQGT